MIAAKHFDPVLGVDIHIIQPPGPVPPLPVPHPFVGMLIDPTEYVPIIGGTVKVNGMMRGVAGTGGKAIPPHIPIGGVFVMPPGNECEMFMGSATVTFDGDPQSRLGDPALSCHSIGMPSIPRLKIHAKPKTLMLPTSVVLAVPMGPPVLVGGPPTISMMGMAMKFGMAALGKVMKKIRKMQKASKKWKAISDKMRNAVNKVLDKVPGGAKLKGKASNAICSLTGHPVDVASGKVTTESTDVELPGPLPFTFSRVWYSQSTYQGPLGHGWHHSYDLGLYRFPEGMVVRLADGRFVVFEPPVPGEPSFDRTEKLFLHLTDRGYHVETLDGLAYHFGWPAKDGDELPLDHVRDPNDNRIVLERERGKLVAFIDSGGRRLPVITDAAGRITEIRVPDPDKPGQTYPMVSFRYDRRGDLVQADDALGNPFKYEYLDHLLVRETDRSGLAFYFMYDGSGPDAKCLRTWGDGNLFLRDLNYDDARQRTEVTDSLGHTTVYEWNAAGLVVKETDPLGGATLTEWSPHNDKLSVTNPNGETTAFEYDDFGRLVSVADPTGATVSYEYDAAGNQVTFTDPNGNAWKREYDDRRNVVAVTDPLGHRQTFRVNDRGLLLDATDQRGNTVVCAWTAGGSLARYTNRLGATERFERDVLGRNLRQTDADGRLSLAGYDRRGLLTTFTDASGRDTTLRYSPAGDVVEAIEGDGRRRSYTYGPMGRIDTVRSAAGRVTRYRYDTELRLVEVVDPAGGRWQFHRDAVGRVTTETTSDGRQLRYTYDPAGRVTECVNARGQRITLALDAAGRVVERRTSEGARETFAYTPRGLISRAKNADAEVSWRYDPCGRMLAETTNGRTVSNRFDAAGNRTARTSPTGRRVEFEYDAEGRLTAAGVGGKELFRSEWDATGHERRRFTPEGTAWEWEFLPTGELTGVRVRGRESFTREYRYDANGRIDRQTDTLFGTSEYAHDPDGYLTSAALPNTERVDYPRDLAGNLRPRSGITVERDGDGHAVGKAGDGGRWRYEFDPLGRLRSAGRDGAAEVTFAYDPLGRRVRKAVGDRPAVEFDWDGHMLLGERSDDPAEYLFRPGTFEPMARLTPTTTAVIECDPVGLPRSAVTSDGEVAWAALFEPFGQAVSEHGTAGLVPLRYPGQYADAETGLCYNWFRYYDPEQGGYLSPDPLGLLGGGGVWDYVPSPLGWTDPYGLACHRNKPRIEDGNLKEGWIHIDTRHVTGNHPKGPGDLFAPGTTRAQISEAADYLVAKGTRKSDPADRMQTFEKRMKVNGKRDRVRVTVDSHDNNRVITIFPVRSE